jgi:hypothetical protein
MTSVNENNNVHAKNTTEFVLSGFNQCIISLGYRGTGKTESLYGNMESIPYDVKSIPNCFVTNIIKYIFDEKNNNNNFIVSISSWCLEGQQIIDLLSPTVDKNLDPLEFRNIECYDYKTACQVIFQSRSNMNNRNKTKTSICHHFLRILLYYPNKDNNNEVGDISYLYIVDLVGLTNIESSIFNKLSMDEKIKTRSSNIQINSLLDELLSTIPTAQRSKIIMEKIHILLNELSPYIKSRTTNFGYFGSLCNENKLRNGKGKLIKINEDYYFGQFKISQL